MLCVQEASLERGHPKSTAAWMEVHTFTHTSDLSQTLFFLNYGLMYSFFGGHPITTLTNKTLDDSEK